MQTKVWPFLLLALVSSVASSSPDPSDHEDNDILPPAHRNAVLASAMKKKKRPARQQRRPSCNEPLSDHHFGAPHRLCAGPPLTPTRQAAAGSHHVAALAPPPPLPPLDDEETVVPTDSVPTTTLTALQRQLVDLTRKEEEMMASLATQKEQELRQQIAAKETSLAKLKTRLGSIQQQLSSSHHVDVPLLAHSNPISQLIPPPLPNRPMSLAENFKQQDIRSGIFLRPTTSTTNRDGKPLRIPDFVSRLLPNEDEKILSTDAGETRLLLSLNNSKPKLNNISVEQFSIANIRIFYELLSMNRLPTDSDVRDLTLLRSMNWLESIPGSLC